MIIRQIRPDEGSKLRAIRLQAIGDSPAAFGSTLAETEARPVEYWDGRAAQGTAGTESVLFVAEDARSWVGLVGSFLDDATDLRSADLISMWVSPACRGRGLGQQLVERVVDWARNRGARRVTLWVTQSNAPAIALYTRCGFRSTGKTQPLPSNPALLEQEMVLDL